MQGDMKEKRISVDGAVKWKFFEKAEKNKKKKNGETRKSNKTLYGINT